VPGTFPGRRQVRDPIAGANILAVQRLLGHDTATMTLDTYGRLFSDDLTNVAKSLAKAARAALSEWTAVRLRYLIGAPRLRYLL
jgi:hypothetical protein